MDQFYQRLFEYWPGPGCQAEVKDEPLDEDTTEPPDIVSNIRGDNEDEVIHDNDQRMRVLMEDPTGVCSNCSCA